MLGNLQKRFFTRSKDHFTKCGWSKAVQGYSTGHTQRVDALRSGFHTEWPMGRGGGCRTSRIHSGG